VRISVSGSVASVVEVVEVEVVLVEDVLVLLVVSALLLVVARVLVVELAAIVVSGDVVCSTGLLLPQAESTDARSVTAKRRQENFLTL
tara:strand:+ start:2205 stop:2468 length:264 start_codon:yes stop_codon:yes gene_type:complete